MANLVELYDLVIQAQALNGVPLSHGHVYVYALGRTTLMDTWSDIDGESLNPNPVILDNAGQAKIYVSDAFDYTLVFTDEFDNEIFSVDKYLLSKGEHSHADVAVAPSEHIGVSSYHVGEVTVYVPYLTGEVGKVYEGIDPIVVNNDVNRISANHIPLGVQEPLYFVEDSETACILGIDSSACGKTYSGISPILVDNTANTISITGDIGKDWTEEILSAANDASAAATAWTDSQGYLTGVDLSEYAKESFVISAIDSSTSGLLPTSAFSTASGSFITALPDDLATTGFVAGVSSDIVSQIPSTAGLASEQWVENKGYLTAVDIPESAVWNATTQTVSANSAAWAGGTANPQIPVTGINGIKISESGDKVVFEVSADYYTNDNPSGFITGVDLSDYATNTQLQAVSADITALIPTALTGEYVEKSAINTITGDNGEYIWTAITGIDNVWISASEAGYATRALTAQTASRAEQAIFAAVAEEWKGASGKLDNSASANFLLTSDSGNFYPMNENPSGYLTAHQSLADYQLTADMTGYLTTADSANFLTAVPDTYLQNTDLTISDGKITEISGVPLSAGDELPSGLMNESAVEYNAVNEISGYNGSAIAQYGAEKQWLVHDDTLVHASNSAQYALGVNISAVSELLGVSGPLLNHETFAGYWNGQPLYQQLLQMTFSSNSTSTAAIPDELYSSAVDNGRRWIDPSNSFIHYGSQEISLPISWMLASGRRGSISIINNALHYRGVDNSNTGCTAYVYVKYIKA